MTARSFDITILGSGTSTGVPVIGCDCAVCRSSDPHNQRSRCSLLLRQEDHCILIDTSPDLRQQALRESIHKVDAVLYTHSHADHMHGIDDLRSFTLHSSEPIPVYASETTLERVKKNFSYIFNQLERPGYTPKLTLIPINQPFDLFGLPIIPIPLLHGSMEVFGYRCGPFAYLTDCNKIPESSFALLQGLDLLVLDGLRFKPHPTHFNIPQAIEVAQRIKARKTWLTHLSHEVDYPRHSPLLPEGIDYAFDGRQQSLQMVTADTEQGEKPSQ